MDLLQLFYYLRQYNADIIVIGGIVAAACYFLGRLLRGKISEKFIVFLPFLLGAALYFAYGALFVGGVAEHAGEFIKHGLSCGSFATAARVICEQLLAKGEILDRSALRAECVKEILQPYGELTDEEAERIAACAETDEKGAAELILALCEGATEAAAELVLDALKEI